MSVEQKIVQLPRNEPVNITTITDQPATLFSSLIEQYAHTLNVRYPITEAARQLQSLLRKAIEVNEDKQILSHVTKILFRNDRKTDRVLTVYALKRMIEIKSLERVSAYELEKMRVLINNELNKLLQPQEDLPSNTQLSQDLSPQELEL